MQDAVRKRLIDSLGCCYQALGSDVWGERTPTNNEFVESLQDQIRTHVHTCSYCDGTILDVDEFFMLSIRDQKKLCLEAGP